MKIETGLCSVTFRDLGAQEVVELVAGAGLDGIEWGGDVHVPHGDLKTASQVRRLCADAGVAVASYGSYYRLAATHEFSQSEVLDTAEGLGARQLRVWAGDRGSDQADEAHRAKVAGAARELAEAAAARAIQVSLEYHGNTLTDTPASAAAFLGDVDHPNLKSYWQRAIADNDAENLAAFEQVKPWLSNLHLFYRRNGEQTLLAAGETFWREVFSRAGGGRYALLEFVRDGDQAAFREDAATLKRLVSGL